MEPIPFKAFAITNEIDLNKIAVDCGIPKKFTWEEPLILKGKILRSILHKEVNDSQQVLVFSFGSIVFINSTSTDEIKSFYAYIHAFEPEIDLKHIERYTDDYCLHIKENERVELTDEYVVVPEFDPIYPELISTVLANSVALEKRKKL